MIDAPVPVVNRGEGEVLNVIGTTVRFVCSAEQTGNAWSAMETVLPEGAGPPLHHHPWDEAYFVVEGDVEFQLGDRIERVTQGNFVYTPAGLAHCFHGISKKPARMIIFDAPAFIEAYFKEVDREVTQLPRDFSKVPEIASRHRMQVLHPEAEER